jgi:peptidoglycan/LPS O-acetylase OafA/YrhL
MKLATIVKWSFITAFIIIIIGAYMKIIHSETAEYFLAIGLLANLLFIISAIFEVIKSDQISNSGRIRWIIAFILFGSLAGMFYFLIERKRMAVK